MDTAQYSLYGLLVSSTVALPEAARADGNSPDVTIERGSVELSPDPDQSDDSMAVEASSKCCRFSLESFGSFLITDGTRIRCDPVSDEVADSVGFRAVLKRQAMGILLHQRGYLVLHASAVGVDDGAVVFCGTRGAGKSTTTAAFHARGHPVIADDVVAIRPTDCPTVVPGVSSVRLSPDAAEQVGAVYTTETVPSGRKRYLRADTVDDTRPLSACYLLERGDGGPATIDPLSTTDAFFSLLTHSYTAPILADTESEVAHFRRLNGLIDRVPCRRLRRSDSLDDLSTTIDRVCDDVRTTAA